MVEGNRAVNDDLIRRLHGVMRPFILRRLKKDVEKQLPNKYERAGWLSPLFPAGGAIAVAVGVAVGLSHPPSPPPHRHQPPSPTASPSTPR